MANCPNCGDHVAEALAAAPMAVCPSCDTTLYRLDGRLLSAGTAGEMHDAPLLFGLGDRIRVAGRWHEAVGHARFAYSTGWWDEFWVEDAEGDGRWVSIDEGDVVSQKPLETPPVARVPRRVGAIVSFGEGYRVTEIDEGRCIALRGRFPERLAVGDTYDYVNCMASNGELLSGETHAGETEWFLGQWLDPFELEIERA
ncbi:DUF4178 domain-containing protein [Marinibacterium profundimaris]|uniref:DUF4178 domain-containing protein n=1 Tax=Marinibacterium profundimaris TaxID=1679460 RepID=A0A225NFN2_9RHOB|nr:DUF4178 domain-containing protein [Marinibacterium profundimaris]OWU72268.1 hypothetical protein ATO3_17095 [Marinibacterium profundimaris]